MGETSHGSPPVRQTLLPPLLRAAQGVPTPRPSTIVPTGAGRHPQALPRSQPRPGRGARSPGQGQRQHRLTSPRKANATTPSTDDEQTQRRSWKTPCPAPRPSPHSQRQTQAGRVTTSRQPLSLRPTVLRLERKPVRWLLRGPSHLWAAAPGPRTSSGLASLWRGLELQRPPLPHTPARVTSWKIRNACLQSLVSLQASRPRWGTWTT